MTTDSFTNATQTKTESALFAGHLIAVGKVVKLNHALPPLDERVINDSEIQDKSDKVEEAIADAIQQLEDIIEEAKTSLPEDFGEELTGILEAQILMLRNKKTLKAIQHTITEEKKPAATAIHTFFTKKADDFSKIPDPKIASKADDLIALRDRLIRNVLEIKHPSLDQIPEDKIIVADSLSPAEAIYLYKKRPAGLLLASGSPSGHVGDLCAGLHIPCAFLQTGSDSYGHIKEGNYLILDGLQSRILMRPTKEQRTKASAQIEAIKQRNKLTAPYKDGQTFHEKGHGLNATGTVGVSTEVKELNNMGVDSVSLYRTEAALLNGQTPPSAEEQVKKVYSPVLQQWKRNPNHQAEPITFRTYDLEGDKRPNRTITLEEKWKIDEEQIGAILDASIENGVPVKIMFPNIRTYEDLVRARAIFDDACESRQDQMPEKPLFGIMLEIPNMITTFNLNRNPELVDFLSVGTNDLPARMLGVPRDDPYYQQYLDPTNPAILAEYAKIIDFCDGHNKPLCFCGGQATNEEYTVLFVGLGARSISVRHGSLAEIRYAIDQIEPEAAAQLLHDMMETLTRVDREKLLNDFNRERNIGVSALLANDNAPSAQPALRA